MIVDSFRYCRLYPLKNTVSEVEYSHHKSFSDSPSCQSMTRNEAQIIKELVNVCTTISPKEKKDVHHSEFKIIFQKATKNKDVKRIKFEMPKKLTSTLLKNKRGKPTIVQSQDNVIKINNRSIATGELIVDYYHILLILTYFFQRMMKLNDVYA